MTPPPPLTQQQQQQQTHRVKDALVGQLQRVEDLRPVPGLLGADGVPLLGSLRLGLLGLLRQDLRKFVRGHRQQHSSYMIYVRSSSSLRALVVINVGSPSWSRAFAPHFPSGMVNFVFRRGLLSVLRLPSFIAIVESSGPHFLSFFFFFLSSRFFLE